MIWLRKKFPVFKSNPRLATFFSISIATFILGFIFFAFTYILPGVEIVKAEEVEWTPPSGKFIMEVHIANNGMVFLQGARVESISGTTIVVSTSWNTTKLQWTIYTNGSNYGSRQFGTSFLDPKGDSITIKNINVGSIVSVNGTFNMSFVEPTVKADVIRKAY